MSSGSCPERTNSAYPRSNATSLSAIQPMEARSADILRWSKAGTPRVSIAVLKASRASFSLVPCCRTPS